MAAGVDTESTTMEYQPHCAKSCPYKQSVSGACGHEMDQALVAEFAENPGMGCPFSPDAE